MRTIKVQHFIFAPIERVFELLTEHAGYVRLPGVKSAKLTRLGTTEPNGLGAVRELRLGLACFVEEITAFERPTRFEYRIVQSRPKLEHQLGRLTFRAVSGGTEICWTSTFRVAVPLLGGLLTFAAARQMTTAFRHALRAVEQLAAASPD